MVFLFDVETYQTHKPRLSGLWSSATEKRERAKERLPSTHTTAINVFGLPTLFEYVKPNNTRLGVKMQMVCIENGGKHKHCNLIPISR